MTVLENVMLTDSKIKSLKPKDKLYKVPDRDGLYVAVSTTGTVMFRYDYRINGRRETLSIGKYGGDGLTLSEAREKLNEARKLVSEGISPASEKRKFKILFRMQNVLKTLPYAILLKLILQKAQETYERLLISEKLNRILLKSL